MSEDHQPATDSLSLSQDRCVDASCDAFEKEWRDGLRPRIEDYLADTPERLRPRLFKGLVQLDIEYRLKNGDRPTREEYEQRFPACVDLIRVIFAQVVPSSPKYEILAEVGRGAMGVVYRAIHKTLDKQVAIKVLLPGKSTKRFLKEAKLLAKVNSPHVVAVYDYEILPDGRHMLCMEWVEGTDLLKVMRAEEGRIPEEKALRWMRDTCLGMLAAAEHDIIHRDFKPSNILINKQGQARVADFGLARGPTNLGDLSRVGDVMGTPFYMAPEQAEDPQSVDTRADIYSFGATFYHAITGQPPFDGETTFSILFKHKTEPLVSPRSKNPEISERTSDVLERCLAKLPSDRFQSFRDLLLHLEPMSYTQRFLFAWDEPDDVELGRYLARYRSRRASYLYDHNQFCNADTYAFPSGRKLLVLRGDIVDQDVEAVVSSDDQLLSMDGGVALAIRSAAGPEMVGEARRYERVRPGRAVVTTGGSLRARFVLHGVTIGISRSELVPPSFDSVPGIDASSLYEVVLPSRDLISGIMASCFYHADSLHVQSIAFPLLGTGAGGFSKDVCLDTMFRFLARMLLRGLTCVREARIVLFDENARLSNSS